MFYSELLSRPIDTEAVKHTYGVNPDTEPDRARAIGIYPLTEVPAGYNVSHYEQETNSTYTAVPECVTIKEQEMISFIRTAQLTLSKLKLLTND